MVLSELYSPGCARICALFRHVPGLYPPITIVSRRRVLVGAAAFQACVLPDLRHLISSIIGVHGGGIDTAALPVENLSLYSSAQYIRIDLLLPPLRQAGKILSNQKSSRWTQMTGQFEFSLDQGSCCI